MQKRALQFELWQALVFVTCVALVLGAAFDEFPRQMVTVAAGGFAVTTLAWLVWLFGTIPLAETPGGENWIGGVARFPFRVRAWRFERRLSRLRRGNPSNWVRSVLGSPPRVEGFGDRLYWSYRVGGRRYTVSFDPRRLLATYSNGLAPDRPPSRLARTRTSRSH